VRVGLLLELGKVLANEFSITMRMKLDSISPMLIGYSQWVNQGLVQISNLLKMMAGLELQELLVLDINLWMWLLTDVEQESNPLQLKTVSSAKGDHQ
jgi:hypothetical protein